MILVTGGAGFIGSHIVDALVEARQAVRVLDCMLPVAHRRRPEHVNPEAEVLDGDLTDPATVRRALRGVDAVCHQAAMVGLGQNMLDIADYVRHNDIGIAVLLRELAAAGFAGRFVLASSMVVYGEGAYRCPRHGQIGASAAHPRAARRAACSSPAVRAASSSSNRSRSMSPSPSIPGVCTPRPRCTRSICASRSPARPRFRSPRCATTTSTDRGCRATRRTPGSPRCSPARCAAGRAPRVFEDGRQRRDFVHVRDVARANVLALTSESPLRGAFNIASGHPRSVGEMATALAGSTGAGAPAPVVTGEFRLGDVRHVFASADRAERVLGFRASEDFDAGMSELATAPMRVA